jgi:peptide chain release factor 2
VSPRSNAACSRLEAGFDYAKRLKEKEELDLKMSAPGFWDDQETAQDLIGKLKLAKSVVEPIDEARASLEDIRTLVELGEEMGESEVEADLEIAVSESEAKMEALEFQVMLGGENDHRNAFLTIQAGAGGNDAADFAEMLQRMYVRWSERRGFGIEEVERTESDEGGIRHATYIIKGPHAFGYLKAERGVHRLVRISPYDSQARRQTSFAAVEVMPEFDADAPIEVDMSEVRVDTYRAGGAGGQHVNKTDSAVRMTHEPTGIVVQCQNERSQHKNRAIALAMLMSKMFEMRERERDDDLKEMYSQKGEIAWGSQIRSYVLHPYQMVKDHRTKFETGNTQAVLDGDLDAFIEEYLRSKSS